MMEFVEPPSGVIISNPAMQLSYCSTDHGIKNSEIPDNAKCYPYKCINKRGKITCRNEPCWIDEVYYNGTVECPGWKLSKQNNLSINNNNKYICDNTYNKNYDCNCKEPKPQQTSTKHNDNDNDNDNNKNNTICIDPCTYRYYTTDNYPCDVHYIQAIEIEPDMNNYGDKICLINDDYQIRRKKKCDPLEVSLLQR